MHHNVVNNLKSILNEVNLITSNCKIIAVSKTFSSEQIEPLVKNNHLHFGENKVQEAITKWIDVKKTYPNLQLHMIGKLQNNKVKFAVQLFDYIHSLDNIRLAEKISAEQKKINKNLNIFIQVNIGNESQKNGINADNLKEFYKKCVDDFGLNIVGLMCIPPHSDNVKIYFDQMAQLNKDLGLTELSMGMSSDYLEAIKCGSTYVRIGSKIFGSRAK
jgi:pyridoxal phosphate enzyme (YggS family)